MKIHLLTALAAEAKPLIAHFKLTRDHTVHAYPYYTNDAMRLIVSGIGSQAAAAATGFMAAYSNAGAHDLFLNVGVAGHPAASIGELFLVSKVVDMDSNRVFYPPLVLDRIPCAVATVFTGCAADTTYQRNGLSDMEAYGFMLAATRHVSGEFCQCIKVVSDNKQMQLQPNDQLPPQQITSLIADKMNTIEHLLSELRNALAGYGEIYADPAGYRLVTDRFQFSSNQALRLKQLLYHWQSLKLPMLEAEHELFQQSNGKAALQYLAAMLERSAQRNG